MMKRKMRDEWVAKLRSGEYEQGYSALSQDGNYCCLGVLCEMQEPGTEEDGFLWWDDPIRPATLRKQYSLPPIRLAGGLGLEQQKKVADLNDSGRTFAQIADWIEQNVKVED